MLRKDFVSNSSSSSYIVAEEDNKFRMILPKPTKFTLTEYLDRYWERDVFGWWQIDESKIKYVSPDVYSKNFGHISRYNLPITCKTYIEQLIMLDNNKPSWEECQKEPEKYDNWSKSLDKVKKDVVKTLIEALQPQWGDVIFHCEEVDDNDAYYDEKDLNIDDPKSVYNEFAGCDTNYEAIVQERIDYMNEIKPLKFYRVFSNH